MEYVLIFRVAYLTTPTVQDELIQLIHSLSSSEKRYFRIFASKHTIGQKNNYEKLFDALDALPRDEPYNEKEFKRSLKGKSWGQNLAVEKSQLYQLLVQALRSYHAESNPETRLYNMLSEIRLLISKNLTAPALRLVEKAAKLSEETENLPVLLILQKYRAEAMPNVSVTDKEEEDEYAEVADEILQVLYVQQQSIQIQKRCFRLYIQNRLKEEIPALKEKIEALKVSISGLKKVPALVHLHILASQGYMAEVEGKFREGMKYYEEYIAHYEQNGASLHDSTKRFRRIISNYLVCALYSEELHIFPATIARLEQLPAHTPREEIESFKHVSNFKMLYMLNTPHKSEGDEVIAKTERGLAEYTGKIDADWEMRHRLNVCILNIQLKRYDKLTKAVNAAFELVKRHERLSSELTSLKFFELIGLYGEKDFNLMDYRLTSTERWLRDNKLHNDWLKELLKIFRPLSEGESPQKLSGPLTSVHCPPENSMLQEIVLDWLKSEG